MSGQQIKRYSRTGKRRPPRYGEKFLNRKGHLMTCCIALATFPYELIADALSHCPKCGQIGMSSMYGNQVSFSCGYVATLAGDVGLLIDADWEAMEYIQTAPCQTELVGVGGDGI